MFIYTIPTIDLDCPVNLCFIYPLLFYNHVTTASEGNLQLTLKYILSTYVL